mmetsp:Transcript_16825/g.24904  ORF Transcript_16825/g.24904 Transcript_16825/m.24904 type:complete len:587 (-) Transcript_16825:33-1793(-)|eukprot:CAMPEP_0171457730 /NCGR_PEP_ID=MMETSP0945-20130129/3693_1 /TAXON_ID=109269 /ORGANISM="Vaucheria litorea, Strain CCMP2940" /LENGTH=586 /DNA_ID=CAMNT_0011983399 /DNA_START=141 /DNA_END=1901 /DNA_ORIENTATION=+
MTAPPKISEPSNDDGHSSDENCENDKEWRDLIKLGTNLDLKDCRNKWCQAEVTGFNRDSMNVRVRFRLLHAYAKRTDIGSIESSYPINSRKIAKLNTHTYGNGFWPKKGQRVEYRKNLNCWTEGEILGERQNQVRISYINDLGMIDDKWISFGDIRPCTSDDLNTSTSPTSPVNSPIYNERREYGRILNSKPNSYYESKENYSACEPSRKRTMSLSNKHTRAIAAASERYSLYLESLQNKGLSVFPIPGDGNCLFRSASHQVYGDDKYHELVRQKCMDYMESEREFFEPYVEGGSEGFTSYLNWKRQNAVWGDDPEVQAFCEIYDCTAEIWAYDAREGAKMLRTFHEAQGDLSTNHRIMRLSYYGGGHYDSIVKSDLVNSFHLFCLYPKTKPGSKENLAINFSKNRRAQNSDLLLNERDREAAQDLSMLRMGRSAFDANHGMLDKALTVSLMLEEDDQINKASDASDLLHVQEQLLVNAQQMSEEEALQKAIKMSCSNFSEVESNKGGNKPTESLAFENDRDLKGEAEISGSDYDQEIEIAKKASLMDTQASLDYGFDDELLVLSLLRQQEEDNLRIGMQKSLEKF